MKMNTLRTGIAICILLSMASCKRSHAPEPTESAPNAGEPAPSESSEQPAAEQPTAENDKAAPDIYRTASSALESEVSDSANKTVCERGRWNKDKEDFPVKICDCGDIKIPVGTECIDNMPACEGRKAVTAIPGFGCLRDDGKDINSDHRFADQGMDDTEEEKKVEYLCALTYGCDLGNGRKCKYTQKLVNGECVSTTVPPKGDFICKEGNCPCGNGFCALGARCAAGKCECGEDYQGTDCSDSEDCTGNDDDCPHCWSILAHGIQSQRHGEFVCDYDWDGGSSGQDQYYYHTCENPDGCHVGDMHFEAGAIDYSGSDARLHDDIREWDIRDIEENHNACPYHIDGDTDTTIETLCPLGDCVIPKKDGHCGVKAMDPSSFHETSVGGTYRSVFNADTCPGGTRWCHGRENAPEKAPAGDGRFGCYNIPTYDDPIGIRAWVCDDPNGCACGSEICPMYLVCSDNHCISQNDYIKRTGKSYKSKFPKKDGERPIYDPTFYTTDPAELDNCGRKSAEEFVQRWEPSIDMAAIAKILGHELSFDPCLTRYVCDSWPVPRKDRDKYVCEHGLYAQKNADGRMIFRDRPLGLRCIDPDKCVCGDSIAHSGMICKSVQFSDSSTSEYDSVSQSTKCKWEIGKDIESQYKFWHNYDNAVAPNKVYHCER